LLGVAQETGLRRRDAGKELVVRVEQACGCPVSVGQRLDVLSFAVTRGAKGALRGLAGLGMKIPVAYRYLIRRVITVAVKTRAVVVVVEREGRGSEIIQPDVTIAAFCSRVYERGYFAIDRCYCNMAGRAVDLFVGRCRLLSGPAQVYKKNKADQYHKSQEGLDLVSGESSAHRRYYRHKNRCD
jgi:hypothetical protein